MKILVFSDTHLSLPFEKNKFYLLEKIINPVDQVIICGDFWEGYQITFDQFLNSPWKKLFPLLKSKKSVYLYGNHDKKIFSDKRVSLFSALQAYRYHLKLNGQIFVFEHGNFFCPFFDDNLHIVKIPTLFSKITTRLIGFMIRNFGKNYTRTFYKRFNDVIKKRVEKEFKKGEIFVCGHTHFAEVDLKRRLINTGFIKFGLAQYLIIEPNNITAKEEKYG